MHTRDARHAVAAGFAASARVVGAAAVIMISVFAAFVPHSDLSVKPVALGLAVGVFVDAFLVRMTLVPAVLTLLGDRAWWLPQWLDRRLPVLDVEGVGLQHQVEHQDWSRTHGPAVVRAENVSVPDVLAPVSLVVREPSLVVVTSTDRAARRALLAALTGRLDVDGRLVVLDRVLPDDAAVLRREVGLLERFPSREDLTRAAAGGLVVVDDVDEFASPDEIVRRWESLRALVADGATVVAGARVQVPECRTRRTRRWSSYPWHRLTATSRTTTRTGRPSREPLQPSARGHPAAADALRRARALVDERPLRAGRPGAGRRRQPRQAGHHGQGQGRAGDRRRTSARRGTHLPR